MTRSIIAAFALLLITPALRAQTTEIEVDEKKDKVRITIGSDGVKTSRKGDGKKEEGRFELQYGMLDLGYNRIHNKPLRSDLVGYINDPQKIDGDILPLRYTKSVNVNIYPLMTKLRFSREEHAKQNFYFTSGVGLQIYNFRLERNYTYNNDPYYNNPSFAGTVIRELDPAGLEKNKIGLTFLSVPVGIQGKTRIAKKATLVYGGGVMGGYLLTAWTKWKYEDDNIGKVKNRDHFIFNNVNLCAHAEVGLDNIFRLYGTYSLTPLQNYSGFFPDQRVYSLGVRFLGL